MPSDVLTVKSGYRQWASVPQRARSPEVDFGVWWYLTAAKRRARRGYTWRVSWIQDTGELYATDMADRYVVLAVIPDRETVGQVMDGWADAESEIYQNLSALALSRFGKWLMPGGQR